MGHPGIVLSGFKVLLKKDLAKDRKLVTWAVWFDGKIGSPDLLYGSIAKFEFELGERIFHRFRIEMEDNCVAASNHVCLGE